jgi:hypothetical protein
MFCESLQDRGYDLALTVGTTVTGLWSQVSGRTHASVEVSRLGERFFARDWAFLFSPAGYRVGLFSAKYLPGICPDDLRTDDKVTGLGTLDSGLGMPAVPDKIAWQPDERVLRIAWSGRGAFDPARYQGWLDDLSIQ